MFKLNVLARVEMRCDMMIRDAGSKNVKSEQASGTLNPEPEVLLGT